MFNSNKFKKPLSIEEKNWGVDYTKPLNDRKTYVYKIFNNFDDKIYIGITCNPGKRWGQHKYSAKTPKLHYNSIHLYSSMYNNGIINYDFDIVECCTSRYLAKDREVYHIDRLKNSGIKVYNITSGGDTCSNHELNLIRNKDIIGVFKTGNFTRGDISEIFGLSDVHISNIVNGSLDISEIEEIDKSLKMITSERLSLSRKKFKTDESIDELIELRQSINPETGKAYSTTELGNMFSVDRKTIRNNTYSEISDHHLLTNEEIVELTNNYHNGILTSKALIGEKYNIGDQQITNCIDKFYENNPNLVRPQFKRISPKRGGNGRKEVIKIDKSNNYKRVYRSDEQKKEMYDLFKDGIMNSFEISAKYNYDHSTLKKGIVSYYEKLGLDKPYFGIERKQAK